MVFFFIVYQPSVSWVFHLTHLTLACAIITTGILIRKPRLGERQHFYVRLFENEFGLETYTRRHDNENYYINFTCAIYSMYTIYSYTVFHCENYLFCRSFFWPKSFQSQKLQFTGGPHLHCYTIMRVFFNKFRNRMAGVCTNHESSPKICRTSKKRKHTGVFFSAKHPKLRVHK